MNIQSKCPNHMIESIFEKKILFKKDKQESWKRLQRRETFVDSQIPPFKVEFDNKEQKGVFKEMELNIHHGPFLHLPAVVGEVSHEYRDLKYLYGAYVISFHLIRPIRLEFFCREKTIDLKLQSYVHPLFKNIWPQINKVFWFFFRV